ncbi:unnamed protein product, partial [Musa acuminata subsp. burmannicoides]
RPLQLLHIHVLLGEPLVHGALDVSLLQLFVPSHRELLPASVIRNIEVALPAHDLQQHHSEAVHIRLGCDREIRKPFGSQSTIWACQKHRHLYVKCFLKKK